MAVRSCGVRSTGVAATTTTFVIGAVLGMLAAAPVGVASQTWDGEPAPSVMIESGVMPGGTTFADGVSGGFATDEGSVVTDEPGSLGNPGVCTHCNGSGCSECGKQAIVDLTGCHCHEKSACWIGRADALLLWRNAPPGGQIVSNNSLLDGNALSAAGMDSTPAAGPRFSIFRVNKCTGNAIEATYLRAANFRSLRPLGTLDSDYALAGPGIYGNSGLAFSTANADLGARLQSFEFNRHHCIAPCVRFLAGFRWIEWQEQFSMQTYDAALTPIDYFQTECYNDLYGGQIGLDANLLATSWIRFDSVVKAGAYYNVGAQTSQYAASGTTTQVAADDSPLSGAFAGEVGLTGVIPLTCCLDIRFGYFGLWLSGIAQPTQQLTGQVLPGPPTVATINSNGGVLVQGVSLGLEGRW